jgi:hypothetical protein
MPFCGVQQQWKSKAAPYLEKAEENSQGFLDSRGQRSKLEPFRALRVPIQPADDELPPQRHRTRVELRRQPAIHGSDSRGRGVNFLDHGEELGPAHGPHAEERCYLLTTKSREIMDPDRHGRVLTGDKGLVCLGELQGIAWLEFESDFFLYCLFE